MKQNWWRSAYKQNHLVFKLGISILFVGFGFRLLFSQSSSVIPDVSDNNIDTPVAEKNVKPIPLDVSESPKIELNHIHPKGIHDCILASFFFLFLYCRSRFELFSVLICIYLCS